MLLPTFQNAYFLQSLGWAIANSLWQVGILWLLYHFITSVDKKLSPVVKHYLSLVLLTTSVTWFIFTIVENYQLLKSGRTINEIAPGSGWLMLLQKFDTLPLLSIAYFIFLFVFFGGFLKNLLANYRLQNNGLIKAPVGIRLFTVNTAIHLGIKKKVQVWISAHVDVPSVTGFLKPVILIPASILSNLTVHQVEAIILHELAHIKRNDYLINIAQSVIEKILFFNPFVFYLGRIARKERENCCDDWVLNFRYDRHDYANALVILEEQRHLRLSLVLAATDNRKALLTRVQRLFKVKAETHLTKRNQFKLACICLILLAGMGTVIPVIEHSASKKTVEPLLKAVSVKNKPSVKSKNNLPEVTIRETLVSSPITPRNNSKLKEVPRSIAKHRHNEIAKEYVDAYINEELLTAPVEVAITVADQVSGEITYFVKIEEQQSGSKQTNTYFLEVNNKTGAPEVKPLLILRKTKENKANTPALGVKDSVLATKKRITS